MFIDKNWQKLGDLQLNQHYNTIEINEYVWCYIRKHNLYRNKYVFMDESLKLIFNVKVDSVRSYQIQPLINKSLSELNPV